MQEKTLCSLDLGSYRTGRKIWKIAPAAKMPKEQVVVPYMLEQGYRCLNLDRHQAPNKKLFRRLTERPVGVRTGSLLLRRMSSTSEEVSSLFAELITLSIDSSN